MTTSVIYIFILIKQAYLNRSLITMSINIKQEFAFSTKHSSHLYHQHLTVIHALLRKSSSSVLLAEGYLIMWLRPVPFSCRMGTWKGNKTIRDLNYRYFFKHLYLWLICNSGLMTFRTTVILSVLGGALYYFANVSAPLEPVLRSGPSLVVLAGRDSHHSQWTIVIRIKSFEL